VREILFRGKDAITLGWAYGDLRHYAIGPYIDTGRFSTPVLQETIGQYTGLKDKAGVRIFEGDVLGFDADVSRGLKYYVKFINGAFWAVSTHKEKDGTEFGDLLEAELRSQADMRHESKEYIFRVIGTIHDTPELLGGK
jgi:uncharacterized phage protein (TIGR01671 family)